LLAALGASARHHAVRPPPGAGQSSEAEGCRDGAGSRGRLPGSDERGQDLVDLTTAFGRIKEFMSKTEVSFMNWPIQARHSVATEYKKAASTAEKAAGGRFAGTLEKLESLSRDMGDLFDEVASGIKQIASMTRKRWTSTVVAFSRSS
jgi:hypothetical protein